LVPFQIARQVARAARLLGPLVLVAVVFHVALGLDALLQRVRALREVGGALAVLLVRRLAPFALVEAALRPLPGVVHRAPPLSQR